MKYTSILVIMVMLSMLVSLVSFTGCVSLMGESFSCPSDIKEECKQARSDAKAAIESKGTKLGKEHNCSIVKHCGVKKIGKMWCWTDPRWPGNYIGGSCSGGRIELGCNPDTMGEVWYEAEKHEFGHYWLMYYSTKQERVYSIDATWYPDRTQIKDRTIFNHNDYRTIWYVFNENTAFKPK